MTWVKLEDSFPRHPKVLMLAPRAKWAYVEALCYCGQYNTDGLFPAGVISAADTKALMGVALIVAEPQGYRIPDFLDYNPSREQVTDERRKARERRAKGGRSSGERRTESHNPDPTRPDPAGSELGSSVELGTAEGKPPAAIAADPFDASKWQHLLTSLIEFHGWPESGRGAVTWPYLMKLRNEYGSAVVGSALSDVSLDEVPPLTTAAGYLRSTCERFKAAVA